MLHVREGPCHDAPENPAITLKYQPDEFQLHSFAAIEAGHHLLVTAHTGSGKTTVAEYAVGRAVRDGARVIYTSPIKALSNQIFGDFRKKYPEWDIGIRTGDIDLHSDAQIVIMTTEILRNMLYGGLAAPAGLTFRDESTSWAARPPSSDRPVGARPPSPDRPVGARPPPSVVIFDEVHYIKDPDRGRVWEEAIIMMPPGVQMILLSATLPDAQEFGTWVATCKGHDVTYVTTRQRVVPLNHYLMLEDRRVLVMDNSEKFDKRAWTLACKSYSFHPSQLNSYLGKIDMPAMFFSFSRQACEQYARAIQCSLVDSQTACEIDRAFQQMIRKFDPVYENMEQTIKLRNLLCKGAGYHHAGLLPALKEIVQELFARALIKVLFVTETFAAGVNLPAKSVVFTGLTKYDSIQRGFRPLRAEEYRQMAGRAGRRGMDKVGHVIILPFKPGDLLGEEGMETMLAGRLQKITSQFRVDYNHVLRMLVSGRQLTDVMSASLLSKEMSKRKEYYASLLPDAERALAACLNPEEVLLLRQYAGILERHELMSMLDQRSRKAHARALKDLPVSIESLLELKSRQSSAERTLREARNALEYYEGYAREEFARTVKKMIECGYVGEDMRPTVKGIECAQINECAGITLIEALHDGVFNGLDTAELLGSLAFFLAGKEDEERIAESLPACISRACKRLAAFYESYEDMEHTREPLNEAWCDLAYVWVKEGRICGDVFLGEFVRNMLKLANIARELLTAATVGQHIEVIRALDGAHGLIVKSLVSPQSLYVL